MSQPDGFVADFDALSAAVDNAMEAAQFSITEVGGDLVTTQTTFEVAHNGVQQTVSSQVDIMLTAEYAESRGLTVLGLRKSGLI